MDFYTFSENIKCVIIFSRTQKLTIHFRVWDFFCSLQKTFQTFSSGVVDLHRVPVITQMIFFSDFTKQSMQVTVSIIFESSPLDYNLNFTKQTSQ